MVWIGMETVGAVSRRGKEPRDSMGRMKKLLYIVVALVLAVGWWFWYAGQEGSVAVQLNADVYPLYSGVTWGEPYATTSPNGPVNVVLSVPVANTTNIAAVSMPFTKYYDDKLRAAGWTRDMMREAGGPGAEVSVYTKGDQFIVVSFQSVFKVKHPDAPSECPCDMQLTLLSGTQ